MLKLFPQLYTRLFSEASISLEEAGRLKYDCFASHLWEERDKHKLDIVTMSYGMCVHSRHVVSYTYRAFPTQYAALLSKPELIQPPGP